MTWSAGRQRLLSQRLVPAGHQQRPGSCGWREQSARLVAATMGQAASSSPSTQSQCLQGHMLRLRRVIRGCWYLSHTLSWEMHWPRLHRKPSHSSGRSVLASSLWKTRQAVEQNINVSCRLYLENGCEGLNVFEWTEQRRHFRVENIVVNSNAIKISVGVLTSHDTFKINVRETGDD